MSSEYTQQQTDEQHQRAIRLSESTATPPGKVPGYELQSRLGIGAFGEVWVGIDKNTGRRVAIKFYLHSSRLDWPLLAHEVEKLVFLSADRYVVQLLDVGWEAEPPYYVMEFMENGSLDDLLAEQGRLPVEKAIDIFHDVAVGLTHAHAKGVLHCDLKPANILLDQDHRPRLADFGQSRMADDQSPTLGTLFYMSPEQADLEAVPDARWDVYALGVLFYCMLTGHPPYRDAAATEKIADSRNLEDRLDCYRQLVDSAPTPTEHWHVPGVDRSLAEIIDRCLDRNALSRFPNTQAVLDQLKSRQLAQSRRPLLVMGLAGPVLLLLIMIMFYWRGFSRAVDQSEVMVREQTYRSNQFAAKYVAKSFEAEIAEFFETAEREAQQAELIEGLVSVQRIETLARLNSTDGPVDPPTELVEAFLADPVRQDFDRHLTERLAANNARADDGPRFASLFIVDRWGTIVAATYVGNFATRSVGKNFSWRTYFHGGPEDLERERPRQLPPHIDATHLSAVFKSTSTNRWKVAVSTPIFHDQAGERQFVGVLAMTVDVGDFDIFRHDRSESRDYFAVLIDDRQGDRYGTILQHPLFETHSPEDDYRLSPEQLAALRAAATPVYQDPLAEAPGGEAFAGDWIAATEPVHLPVRGRDAAAHDRRTGLLVLVQVHADAATAAVQQLGNRLAFDGVLALCFVGLAVTALWLVVLRLLRPVSFSERAS